jgi:hypothetical protein
MSTIIGTTATQMHQEARIGGLTWAQITHAIETRPTVPVWPIAGPALGYRSKSAAYDAAAKGHIRVIKQGRKRPVPTTWLRHVLGWRKTLQRPRSKSSRARRPVPSRQSPKIFRSPTF